MKKILTIICVLISTISFAQCGLLQCENQITLPLPPSGSNAFNNLNNLGGSRCFVNSPGQINDIPNNFNWNNWNYLTFQYGLINVFQNINYNGYGKKVFVNMAAVGNISSGICNMSYVSMNGQYDTLFLMAGILNINTIVANNHYNYISMASGTTLTINGNFYIPGQQWTGGGTGQTVNIISCQGTPLANHILSFKIQNDVLKWKVESEYMIDVEYSGDGKNFEWYGFSYQKDGGMIVTKPGFYRLKVDGEYSKLVEYNPYDIIDDKQKLYFYDFKFQFTKPEGRGYGYKIMK